MKSWFMATRPYSFTASLIPAFIGGILANAYNADIIWIFFPLVLICFLTFHAGTNLINDYFDYKNGIDINYEHVSSKTLLEKKLTPKQIFLFACILFGIGFLFGIPLMIIRGIPMVLIGILGFLGGYFYTAGPIAYKYRGVGELFVFIIMGPLMVLTSYFALTGNFDSRVLVVSLPIGFFVTAILCGNNIRDFMHDKKMNIKTSAILLGFSNAKKFYVVLNLAGYLSVILMIWLGVVNWLVCMVFLTIPLSIKNMIKVKKAKYDYPGLVAMIDVESAKVHLLFGILFLCSIFFSTFLFSQDVPSFEGCDSYSVVKRKNREYYLGYSEDNLKFVKTNFHVKSGLGGYIDFEVTFDERKIVELEVVNIKEDQQNVVNSFKENQKNITDEFVNVPLNKSLRYRVDIKDFSGVEVIVSKLIKEINLINKDVYKILRNKRILKIAFRGKIDI